jgi:hypothetical protein
MIADIDRIGLNSPLFSETSPVSEPAAGMMGVVPEIVVIEVDRHVLRFADAGDDWKHRSVVRWRV